MGLFSRKKKLTKEQREELDKARDTLREESKLRNEEIRKQREWQEKRRQDKNNQTVAHTKIHISNQQERTPYDIQARKNELKMNYVKNRNLLTKKLAKHIIKTII